MCHVSLGDVCHVWGGVPTIGACMMGINRRSDEKEEVWCSDGYEGGHACWAEYINVKGLHGCMKDGYGKMGVKGIKGER